MKSVVILIDYFGAWPKWFPVFLASCRWNPTINWVIRTDCLIPDRSPPNVKFIQVEYCNYVKNISKILNINFSPSGNYKICDVRPAYGDLYFEDVKNFDYYGFGDLDVIYGDIRKFYNDDVLSFDVVSTHEGMLSGHLSLFRNTDVLRKAYLKIPRWKYYMEHPESLRFDEDVFTLLFVTRENSPRLDGFSLIDGLNCYFKEQYTTVFHPMTWHDGTVDHPDQWFWKHGVVTNSRNIGTEYLYLHLMNFQSMRWTNPICRESNVPWNKNPDALFTIYGEEEDGVRIDWSGIRPIRI